LGGTLGDVIHPRKSGLFEAILFAMQINGCQCFTRFGVFSDFALEPPVISEAGTPRVFAAEGLLGLVQLQLRFVAPMNP